jgi:hypothetical protein
VRTCHKASSLDVGSNNDGVGKKRLSTLRPGPTVKSTRTQPRTMPSEFSRLLLVHSHWRAAAPVTYVVSPSGETVTIGITVGSITDEIGASDFVHAFFSTVSTHCEPDGWGTRFPHLMNELYKGVLPFANAHAALEELHVARGELSRLPPSAVVWDIDDPDATPPWGDRISDHIKSLDVYFISSTGRDVFDLLEEAVSAASDEKCDAILG